MADLNLSSVRLPPAFQECEWIESHGTEYIDANFRIDGASRFEQIAEVLFPYEISSRQLSGAERVGFWGVTKNGFFEHYQVSTTKAQPFKKYEVDWTVYVSQSKSYREFVVDGDLILGPTESSTLPSGEVGLLALLNNAGVPDALMSARLFSAKYKLDEQLIRDFIPCYLKTAWNGIPSGTIGMYDLCGSLSSNGTPFYTNEGTGAFTKGSDVVHADAITINGADVDRLTDVNGTAWTKHGLMLPHAFQRCEYIESHGTEYINTNLVPGTSGNYSVEMRCKVNYTNGRHSLFGAYNWHLFIYSSSEFSYICIYAPGSFSSINSLFDDFQTVKAEKNHVFLNGNLAFSFGKDDDFTPSTQNRPIYLFDANQSRFNDGPISAKLKTTIIRDILSGAKVRDFIPVYLKTSWNNIPAGTIGMYDLCGSICPLTNTPFYINAGTGEFTKGADIA